ncbi:MULTISPECIES: hypothetical protein [Enterobacter cloacae complex]|uniref:hypothetical protein n=1 Tax=Enterobacter TaxID=547 RepID=UPI00200419D4|nr:hypothetical protein [Enterobacter kobei]MCK7111084.1 hypothetical protein [Enterobacter kobei]
MSCHAINGVDFSLIPEVIACSDKSVWRYIMEGGYSGDGVIDLECFEILEKDDFYLSFYHSNKDGKESKVAHVHKLIKLSKTKPALYLCIDVQEVNVSTEDRTYFFDATYPHIGMSYKNSEELNSIEIKTILMELSDVYERAHGGAISRIL